MDLKGDVSPTDDVTVLSSTRTQAHGDFATDEAFVTFTEWRSTKLYDLDIASYRLRRGEFLDTSLNFLASSTNFTGSSRSVHIRFKWTH